jgi:hypothetical protein
MPISVVCSSCQARFTVSDKFAGKKGPCPKCKAIITVPAVQEEIKVHVPEEFQSGGKDTKGRLLTKPIERKDTKVQPVAVAALVAGIVVVVALAFALRRTGDAVKLPLIVAGLVAISGPIAAGGYTFLRNDELEPYRGRALWIRAALCGLAYAALWGAYWPLASYNILSGDPWEWLFVAPVFVGLGAAASFASLDLDFGSGALHYSFYLLLTLLLRAAAGLPHLWSAPTLNALP